MPKAFIQTRDDPILRSVANCAWDGFNLLGYETEWFTVEQFKADQIPITRETVVSGFIWVYLEALKSIGIEPPFNIEYPEQLRKYLGRQVFQSTVAAVNAEVVNPTNWPKNFFVKPYADQKGFTGFTVDNQRLLLRLKNLSEDAKVWVSEPVNFVSEYRFFVLRHEVVGVGHYKGDPCVFPDGSLVKEAAATWTESPTAYCIDFGVCENGKTLLVEANDGHSMGDYGLSPPLYARLLEARWCELTGTKPIP